MRTWTLIICFVVAVGLALFIATRPGDPAHRMQDLELAVGFGVLILIFFLGLAVLVDIAIGRIDLSLLLTEQGGGASMSRFQLMIFTFVVSLSLLLIVVNKGDFPKEIPNQVLALLGISATTYGVSKGIQASGGLPGKGAPPPPDGN